MDLFVNTWNIFTVQFDGIFVSNVVPSTRWENHFKNSGTYLWISFFSIIEWRRSSFTRWCRLGCWACWPGTHFDCPLLLFLLSSFKSFHDESSASRQLSAEIDKALAAAGTVPRKKIFLFIFLFWWIFYSSFFIEGNGFGSFDIKNLPPYRLGDIDRTLDIVQVSDLSIFYIFLITSLKDDSLRTLDTRQIPNGIQRRSQLIGKKVDVRRRRRKKKSNLRVFRHFGMVWATMTKSFKMSILSLRFFTKTTQLIYWYFHHLNLILLPTNILIKEDFYWIKKGFHFQYSLFSPQLRKITLSFPHRRRCDNHDQF